MPLLLLKTLWVLGFLHLIQSVLSLKGGFDFRRYLRRCQNAPAGDYAPYAAVIIPCKGVDEHFEENLTRYLTQDYPRYQVILCVATRTDPAYGVLWKHVSHRLVRRGAGLSRITLEVAGLSDQRGEKVHNLLRGIEVADRDAQVLVFGDIDACPKPDWLRLLVAPLGRETVMVSTGFRWYLPGPSFASRLRAAWDTSIATMLGDHGRNFAWGGSMAIRKEDFDRLEVADRYWARTVSDDYALTRAVREAKGKIRFEPRCLVASHGNLSLREFFRWSSRQIIITRVYAPHLWRLGLMAHSLHCGTFVLGVLCLAWPGLGPWSFRAILALLLVLTLLGLSKGYMRTRLTWEMFPEEKSVLDQYGGCYWRLAPLVPWVMLWNFVVAGFSRRIEWRGTLYDLRSASEVRVLRRGSA